MLYGLVKSLHYGIKNTKNKQPDEKIFNVHCFCYVSRDKDGLGWEIYNRAIMPYSRASMPTHNILHGHIYIIM
jgi:hypothetical protein